MSLADAIRKHGFTRWYERQLYESFAYLVSGFLALIMMAIAMEVTDFRGSFGGLVVLVAVAACGAMVCVVTWDGFTRSSRVRSTSPARPAARGARRTRGSTSCRRAIRSMRSKAARSACGVASAHASGRSCSDARALSFLRLRFAATMRSRRAGSLAAQAFA